MEGHPPPLVDGGSVPAEAELSADSVSTTGATVEMPVETSIGLREVCGARLQRKNDGQRVPTRRNFMLRSLRSSRSCSMLLLLCGVSMSSYAWADCCPGDGNGAPKASSGMGESFPAAIDLAADSEWQVYEFERDGIFYTQVNDQSGAVRAAIGRIGDTYWVLPIGQDADRVFLPYESTPPGIPQVVFKSEDIEIMLYQDGDHQRWLVRTPDAAR